ncbi:hypothetical protein [Candidatus Nitrosotenuis uzonensis]|uniref:Uncharacterized protein n=1 Tax=Candidatus Nitrosotenuis uzonensis TaxID=1407055 RepID=V6ARY0_9ARCH|nr:hypothetical protein [Candidatus Nitrosotenuis uzonensis]CDI05163.1 conserved hypothetical protein [Candidatus Nitrosotenuis uzonensis]
MSRVNINVSATDYDKSSREITSTLTLLEEMVHETDGFVVTDSEFAFGWHFFVVSVRADLVQKLADQMGHDFEKLKGKTPEKKFLFWLQQKMDQKGLRIKFAIKEEMESSKYGIF